MAKEGIVYLFLWFFDPMPIRGVKSAFEDTSSQKVNSLTIYDKVLQGVPQKNSL